jgi:hypothetical protein
MCSITKFAGKNRYLFSNKLQRNCLRLKLFVKGRGILKSAILLASFELGRINNVQDLKVLPAVIQLVSE